MKTTRKHGLALAAGCAAAACLTAPAYAARPMITDDARTVDPKSCQIESWVKDTRDRIERWALPACNPTSGAWEFTLGGATGRDERGESISDVQMQVKTLFKTLETNGWGYGVSVGSVSHPSVDARRNLVGDIYVNVPVSKSYRDDRYVVHLNLGALRERDAGHTRATWGLGSEIELHPRAYLIAETFGQTETRPFYQVGLRLWIVPDRVQVDTTFGDRWGHESETRWLSLGLRLLSPAFLP